MHGCVCAPGSEEKRSLEIGLGRTWPRGPGRSRSVPGWDSVGRSVVTRPVEGESRLGTRREGTGTDADGLGGGSERTRRAPDML